MTELKIRRVVPSDLNPILQIERDTFKSDAFSKRTFVRFFKENNNLFVVAIMDRKIIGYMITNRLPDRGYIASIAVDSTYRRKGVGRALTNFTFKELIKDKLKAVELDVKVTNKEGIHFWKNLGFFSIMLIPCFYSDGKDAIKMRKTLRNDE